MSTFDVPRSIRHVPQHLFIKELVTHVRAGFGLVPFLGSGCSARSGILMGSQFNDYLAWTVALCVSGRSPWPEGTGGERRRWDLRRRGWPPYPTHEQLVNARRWALDEFRTLANECGLHVEVAGSIHKIQSLTRAVPREHEATELSRALYAPFVPPFLRGTKARLVEFTDGRVQRHLHDLLKGPGLLHGGLQIPGISPTSEDAITERAIRSLYDWRSTLHFLSELKLGKDERTLFLDDADASVIDSFNVYITRGRRPNLLHTMLCHLRQPARMRIILTTNFDTLIEDAFAHHNRRMEVISVSVKGGLPDPEIVHARDSIIKLHGTFSETRADFSLDEQPTPTDKNRFFHFVRGGYPDADQPAFVPAHLLVAGYSGSDARCVQFIKSVVEGDPSALVFWICYCKRDFEQLCTLFRETTYGQRIIATTTERVDLLLYEFHQQLCLTLPPGGGSGYHLNHNVAPSSSFRPKERDEDSPSPGGQAIVDAVNWLVSPDSESRSDPPDADSQVLVIDGPSGVLDAMRSALDDLSATHGLHKVWIELEDYGNTASLAHDLFQIIAMRRGILLLGHAEFCPESLIHPKTPEAGAPPEQVEKWVKHIEGLKEYLGIEPAQWVIALYGRNGPGGCVGWSETGYWTDDEYGTQTKPGTFNTFLLGLHEAGFNVLYAPYSAARRIHDEKRREDLVAALVDFSIVRPEAQAAVTELVGWHFRFPESVHDFDRLSAWYTHYFPPKNRQEQEKQEESAPLHRDETSTNRPNGAPAGESLPWRKVDLTSALVHAPRETFIQTVRGILRLGLHRDRPSRTPGTNPNWSPSAHWRYNFLYGASLFRQSRHYSALLCEGVIECPWRFNSEGHDNDLLRDRQLETFLPSFDSNPRVFLRKTGGFAWLYRDIRLALRCLVEAASDPNLSPQSETLRPVRGLRARAHHFIGDWYLRAFYVSNHASAVVEAGYHFFQSIVWSGYAEPSPRRLSGDQPTADERKRKHREVIWRRGLRYLVKTLRHGEAAIRTWFGFGQFRTWFSGESVGQLPDSEKSLDHMNPNAVIPAILHAWNAISNQAPLSETDRATLEVLEAELAQFTGMLRWGHPILYSARSLQGVSFGATQSADGADKKSAGSQHDIKGAIEFDSPDEDWWKDRAPEFVTRLLESLRGTLVDGTFRESRTNSRAATVQAEGENEWEKAVSEARTRYENDPAAAAQAFQQLVEWTYILLRRAKREENGVPLQGSGVDSPASVKPVRDDRRRLLCPLEVRRAWARVSCFANLAADAVGWIVPGNDIFINYEMSKALTLYGLALARLGRFFEAHRRLNHAEAILADPEQPDSLSSMGLIDLRRAEAYIVEAQLLHEIRLDFEKAPIKATEELEWFTEVQSFLSSLFVKGPAERPKGVWEWLEPQLVAIMIPSFRKPNPTTPDLKAALESGLDRAMVARTDDAWGCLERAEALLAGRVQSPLWWSRLRALQMLALATVPDIDRHHTTHPGSGPLGELTVRYRPLSSRVRSDPRTVLRRLWREGIAASPTDWYNRMRLLDHYCRAERALRGRVDDATIRAIHRELTEIQKLDDSKPKSYSKTYYENVSWKIRQNWPG